LLQLRNKTKPIANTGPAPYPQSPLTAGNWQGGKADMREKKGMAGLLGAPPAEQRQRQHDNGGWHLGRHPGCLAMDGKQNIKQKQVGVGVGVRSRGRGRGKWETSGKWGWGVRRHGLPWPRKEKGPRGPAQGAARRVFLWEMGGGGRALQGRRPRCLQSYTWAATGACSEGVGRCGTHHPSLPLLIRVPAALQLGLGART
jgi:hypothetical protein